MDKALRSNRPVNRYYSSISKKNGLKLDYFSRVKADRSTCGGMNRECVSDVRISLSEGDSLIMSRNRRFFSCVENAHLGAILIASNS